MNEEPAPSRVPALPDRLEYAGRYCAAGPSLVLANAGRAVLARLVVLPGAGGACGAGGMGVLFHFGLGHEHQDPVDDEVTTA
jgi:hypothetical protein